VGEGFIDGRLQLKSDVIADKIFASMIKQSFKREKVSDNESTFKDLSKSILSSRNLAKSKMDHSLDLSSSRTKISVINHNTNIKIPQ
jgi:hypothetical protein